MSEEIKAASGAPDSESAGSNQEIEEKSNAAPGADDSVKYDTYIRKKKLADNLASAKRELEDKVTRLEQDKLEAEGKKDEVIEHLKKQVAELGDKNKNIVGNFAYNSISSQIEAEAAKLGCVDTGALTQLMDVKEFTEGMDTETFRANADELKAAIEGQKKSRPYLFNKQGPQINTANPNATFTNKEKSIADLSAEEQDAMIKNIDKQEGKTLGF